LDEIGDASPRLQAKLLAFLDDYRVFPRGYNGAEGIYCPVMIVAATNRPLREWAKDEKAGNSNKFRNDLFQRFDVVIDLPSIEQRREDIPLMVDLLLQDPAINPEQKIKKLSDNTMNKISEMKFDQGNFRELERVLKDAIQNANYSGRNFLVSSDLPHQD
jgi:transcriptional regulator with GAF, ATPase, and Fis domain